MNVVVRRWHPTLGAFALVLGACHSDSSGAAAGSDAASASAMPSASTAASARPAPLSSTPPLPPPKPLPAAGLDAGIKGLSVLYAQARDAADVVTLAGVDREKHRALLEIARSGSDAPVQLVTVNFASATVEEAWSPSQAFARITSPENIAGPSLADELDAGSALQEDVVGWGTRLAGFGPPWNDGHVATAPGAKHVIFPSGDILWGLGPSRVPYRMGSIGHNGAGAKMSPDGDKVAWWGVVDRVRGARPRLVVGEASTGNQEAIQNLADPEGATWSRDGSTVYTVATGLVDGGPATGCLHAIDAKTHAPKVLTCVAGGSRGIALSPDGHHLVLASRAVDPKPVTDLVLLELPGGQVKRRAHIPIEGAAAGLVDDKGLFVTVGSNGGSPVLSTVDLMTGKVTTVKYSGDALRPGGWIGPRSFIALRTTPDAAMLVRIDVDALVSSKLE